MLVKYNTFAAMTLGALMLMMAFQPSNSNNGTIAAAAGATVAEQLDGFGVEKIYPTKSGGGNEWYVNMNDPTSDSLFKNLPPMTKQSDGSWQVSGGSKGQVRLEAWSPVNEKWLNVEITAYAKIESGTPDSNSLIQLYSRGGHHTSSDECLGSAYKGRLYNDGRAAWTKEVTHPAYAGNRGMVQATTDDLESRWVGFKAIIYNFVENGKTYVRMESYIDDDVTDSSGNLVVRNNWKLASVVEDRGGWATNNSDFDSSCGRARDEILADGGGTATQNIAAWRSDGIAWSFKYLSVREIDPTAEHEEEPTATPAEPEPTPEEPIEAPTPVTPEPSVPVIETYPEVVIAGQHFPDNNNITTINAIDLQIRKMASIEGNIVVAISKGGSIVAADSIDITYIGTGYVPLTAQFSGVDVAGGAFDVLVLFEDSGNVAAAAQEDYMQGNFFSHSGENPGYDMNIVIR